MGICLHQSFSTDIQLAVWHIVESEQTWQADGWLPTDDLALLHSISHPQKRLEFIAGRAVVRFLLTQWRHHYRGIMKTTTGKPTLPYLGYSVSLSHSFPYATALIHKHKEVGIDIEYPKEKLHKIAPRFLSEEELLLVDNDLHLITTCWCAKEALYKLHAKGDIIFKHNLKVIPSEVHQWDQPIGKILLDNQATTYTLRTHSVGAHIICWVY